MSPSEASGALPLWLKLAYTAWFVVWIPVYWVENGPANFLWLCDVANIIVLAAVWRESPLLFSSQTVSVLLIQLLWMVDVGTRALAGFHPIGGTEYMFEPWRPLAGRLLSLFHVFIPLLLLFAIWRLGYDRRGWRLQTLICWLVLPVSFMVGEPSRNLNWLWAPFGVEQRWLPPLAFLGLAMLAYPLLIYLPTHAALLAWARGRGRPHLIAGGGRGRPAPATAASADGGSGVG